VTSDGCSYLGAAMGISSYIQTSVAEKAKILTEEVKLLSKITEAQPHASYCAFSCMNSLAGDCVVLYLAFTPLENVFCQVFIPTATTPSDSICNLFLMGYLNHPLSVTVSFPLPVASVIFLALYFYYISFLC